jgi:hypothetical protein
MAADIKKGPAAMAAPRTTSHRKMRLSVTNQRIQQNALGDEVKRTVLRESLTRFRNELMDEDERELLWDRILRLRRQLKLAV